MSFNQAVASLKPNECASRVRRIGDNVKLKDLGETMPDVRQQLRNAVAPAIAAAKKKTEGQYSIEVGDVLMPGGTFYAVAVVTRVI